MKKKILSIIKFIFYAMMALLVISIFIPMTESKMSDEDRHYNSCYHYSELYKEHQRDMFASYKLGYKEKAERYKRWMNEVYDDHERECDTTGYQIGDYPGQ